MVKQYTQKALSYETDKISALSGLASIIEEKSGETFLAGLWRNDIRKGLLWHSLGYTAKLQRPDFPGLAPSWSWVSVKGATHYGWGASGIIDAKAPSAAELAIVDAYIQTALLGGGCAGQIQAWGHIVRVRYEPNTHRLADPDEGLVVRAKRLNPRAPRLPRPPPSPPVEHPPEEHHHPSYIGWDELDAYRAWSGGLYAGLDFDGGRARDAYCLRVGDFDVRTGADDDDGGPGRSDRTSFYLILRRTAEPLGRGRRRSSSSRRGGLPHPLDLGVFERIGIGAAAPETVARFFGRAGKRFLTLV
jgi:hypothetical protein